MKDILIIGSGPAGYTAAIYASRANRSVTVVCGQQPGGQLTITTDIENYPGFENAISGPYLMEQMKKQAENAGAHIVHDTIVSVDFSQSPFLCVGASGNRYESKSVIIATGASAKWLGLSSELKYRGKGVSACATCDGFFFKNKAVAVIGGGNTAVEEALYLSNFAQSVTLIHRRSALRAEKIMQKRLFENPKIHVIWESVVLDIRGTSKVTDLELQNLLTGEVSSLPIDGVFVAIGHQPATAIFQDKIAMDSEHYIITEGKSSKTSVNGVFAAGDVCDPVYRQAVTSAGQGCVAALDADKFLSIKND